MRTVKRFDPLVLARFDRQGRGQGALESYLPWHQVTRGDPASSGRSHLMYWRGRLRHLLSDLEWGGQLFALMPSNVHDSTEQLPLTLEDSNHPLSTYTARVPQGDFPGTLSLASQLGVRHPRVHGRGESKDWRATTDLVVVFGNPIQGFRMLAIAVKPSSWTSRRRTLDLLRLERAYWEARGVEWLLITPAVWSKTVVLTLRRICPWAMAEAVPSALLDLAVVTAQANPWATVTALVEAIEKHASDRNQAQCALWQAVWSGALPIDLTRGWRPQEPLRHLAEADFWLQNPIVSRRSAWI